MIETRNIEKTYVNGPLQQTVLKNINLTIHEGEFISIMGPSGAGKSTLLYQLGLLDHPTSGEIIIDGINTEKLTHDERTNFRLHKLGFVFQDYALLPELTAIENVSITLFMQGVPQAEADKMSAEALTNVGLGGRLHHLPSQLSGGEQQRVSVARAIAHNPKILFADEPTANLDSERSLEIMDIFRKLNKAGQTIIMVTHEPEFATFTERTVNLKDGSIVSDIKNKI